MLKGDTEVAVFVTVKDSVKTIKKCIDSLLNQTFPKEKYRIFVVDAYSKDGTYEILKEYADKGLIELYRLEGNAAKAFNWAIKNIDAQIIAMTDADCVADRNWLKNLVRWIGKKYIGAAGPMLTPKEVEGLQRAIGEELDFRFLSYDRDTVERAPTANLAFLTEYGKKVLFDERLKVAFETDFGYRLSKLGKIKYDKDAVVYHYHRSSWKSFFKQQMNYARYALRVYLRHKDKVTGDHITRRYMMIQAILFAILVVSTIAAVFDKIAMVIAALTATFLGANYVWLTLKVRPKNPFLFILMLFVRNVAWFVGAILGLLDVVKEVI